jgi:hypothetical protein
MFKKTTNSNHTFREINLVIQMNTKLLYLQNKGLGFVNQTFQAEVCADENIKKGYWKRNIYILSDSQTVIKVLDCCEISSRLVWDCYQSLMKLAEHNSTTDMGART